MSDDMKRLETQINKGLNKHQALNAVAGAGASMPKKSKKGKDKSK